MHIHVLTCCARSALGFTEGSAQPGMSQSNHWAILRSLHAAFAVAVIRATVVVLIFKGA